MKTLMVIAGGTGGHIMPGLAVADHLRSLGWRIAWMGNPQGMEARLTAERDFLRAWVDFSGLRGKGLVAKLTLPSRLLLAFWQARHQLLRIRPDVVLGMGGYMSFPGGLMAAQLGIPLVIHEQNAVAGLANRVLARLADRVLSGFPDVLANGVWLGNPLRADFAQLPPPAERLAGRSGPLRLLILGGSLGARPLNETVPRGLALLPADQRPEVVHQCGEQHRASVQTLYASEGLRAHCVPFIAEMAEAYAWADLVICRAGAMTIAELAAAGVASVLIPLPHAVDDHQTANARFLANAGAAILLPQQELTPEIISLLRNLTREQLLQMAERARALAKPDATRQVARVCEELSR